MSVTGNHAESQVNAASRKEDTDYPRTMSIDDVGSPSSGYRPKRAIAPMSKVTVLQVATYQRYSDDKQGQKSEDRQLERNEEFNKSRIQGVVVRRYTDRGQTGVQMGGRTELEEMLDDASKNVFSVLIIEELSRLARDREDTFRIFRLLACYDVSLYESSTGIKLDLIALVFKAFLAEKERINALTRARHGRTTAVGKGEIMHFANYGYMRDPTRSKAFLKHPENALAVQDIFNRAANGDLAYTICKAISGLYPTPHDCRKIAKGLVPPSTRSQWEPTSIQRIVENPIYAGVLIDGRTMMVHDPDNYVVKAAIPVDHAKWQRVDAPDLALISIDLWLEAQEAFTSRGRTKKLGQGHKYLLNHLTFCAKCGQSVKIALRGQYECFSPRSDCRGIGHLPAAQLERKVLHLLGSVSLKTGGDHSGLNNYVFGARSQDSDELRDALQMELSDLERKLNDDIVTLCHTGEASQSKINYWMSLEQRIEELRRRISLLRNSTKTASWVDLNHYLKAWNADIPFSPDDPRATEVIDAVKTNVDKVTIDLQSDEYLIKVHLQACVEESSQNGPAQSVLIGTFPNLDTHDDGIRIEVLSERLATFGSAKSSVSECDLLIEEIEKCENSETRRRLQAVLKCIGGSTCHEAGKHIDEKEHIIFQWLIAYRNSGVELLKTICASKVEEFAKQCIISDSDAMAGDAGTTSLKRRIDLSEKVLLLAMDGMMPHEIADRMSITRKTVFTILIGMEIAGYEGTLKSRRPRINLTTADLNRIKQFIAIGLDPSDTGVALTQRGLLAWCKKEFHIDQVDTTLRNFLSRNGVKVSDAPKLGLSNKDQEGKKMREFLMKKSK